jgi:hypothetical protein
MIDENLLKAFESAGALAGRASYLASKLHEHDIIMVEAVSLLAEHQAAHGLAKDHAVDEASEWRRRRDAVIDYVLTQYGPVETAKEVESV